jgi:octaprenyl-diphosphate synthase
MSSLSFIKAPIEKEMQQFETVFRNSMKTKVPLLDIIMNFIIRRKGKQMRPMFVFLTAKMLGVVTEKTFTAATLIELLHTATLIHDDVVDEAYERRNFFSINALWKNKISILVGDYLLSRGLLYAIDNEAIDVLRIVSNAVKEMSEGELLQIEKARKLDITEDIYFEVIKKKTATLIASCTASAAVSTNCSDDMVKKMWQFGEFVGIAFQIKDDIFDYQKSSLIGKPTGNDIKEKKMTLPLIHVLNNISEKEKNYILKTVKKHNKNQNKVNEVIQFVIDKGGIEYATKIMKSYRDRAIALLSDLPENDAKLSLIEMVNYTVDRNK